MIVIKTSRESQGYVWKCPLCGYRKKMTHSTPLIGLNIKEVDKALELWIENANPVTAD